MNKYIMILGGILVAAFIVTGVFYTINRGGISKTEVLSPEQVSQKVIDFVNGQLLQGKATASLVSITRENGLYKIKFNIGEQEIESYATTDGKFFFPDSFNLEEASQSVSGATQPAGEENFTVGNFSVSNEEVCKEGEKPIVYFFGSKTCPHCSWEYPIVKKVMENFKKEVSFHDNMDSDKDGEVFTKYSSGGVPTIVLGCKYFRVGSGEKDGEEVETKNLTALTCKLAGNKPESVCSPVQDLINQIKD